MTAPKLPFAFAALFAIGCQRSGLDGAPSGDAATDDTGLAAGDTSTDSADSADPVDTASDTAAEVLPPCTFAVPANARVISDDTSIVEDAVVGWVCRNTTLSYAGTGGTFYLGARAELVLARIGGNTVYAERNAALHNFGPNALVVGDAGDVLDESEGTAVITTCPNLLLDLDDAPIPGCDG